jgi:hypothetical protein
MAKNSQIARWKRPQSFPRVNTPLFNLRQEQRLFEKVRALPDLLQGAGLAGPHSRVKKASW